MQKAGEPRESPVTLFGWPRVQRGPRNGGTVEVLGVPSDAGNIIASGPRFGPNAIRHASLRRARPNIEGVDLGDADFVRHCDRAEALDNLQRVVEDIAERNSLPIILGGDHSLSYAVVAALRRASPLNVIWFDAHTDFSRLPDQVECHNHAQVLRRIGGLEHVGRIVQVGHRGITYHDESRASQRIIVVTASTATQLPTSSLLDLLPADQPLYVSVDIDVVDPRWAPGTGHPVPGGLSAAQLIRLVRAIAESRRVVGVDLMEVNPLLDHDQVTADVAALIALEIVSALARSKRFGSGSVTESGASLSDSLHSLTPPVA